MTCNLVGCEIFHRKLGTHVLGEPVDCLRVSGRKHFVVLFRCPAVWEQKSQRKQARGQCSAKKIGISNWCVLHVPAVGVALDYCEAVLACSVACQSYHLSVQVSELRQLSLKARQLERQRNLADGSRRGHDYTGPGGVYD